MISFKKSKCVPELVEVAGDLELMHDWMQEGRDFGTPGPASEPIEIVEIVRSKS